MTATKPNTTPVVLLVEADVIVRFALADYLRACGATVIEAADAQDARAILVAGPVIDVLLSDAQLAVGDNGFALAQWVRRHRPAIEVVLTSSIENKAHTANQFCARYPDRQAQSDAVKLAARIQGMLAERKRRMRTPPATSAYGLRRRRR